MDYKDAIILELRNQVEELRKENAFLKKEIEELKELLHLNSKNSSKPPSTDRNTKKEEKPPRKIRPPRQGFSRRWFSPEEVSEVIQYFPQSCDSCGQSDFVQKSKVVEARQVVELPVVKPLVTEHQAMSCRCARCGKQVRASLPQEAISSAFGPKIKALSCFLAGDLHLSKRNIQKLFSTFFNIDISLGSVSNIENQAAQLLSLPYEEGLNALRKSLVIYADETSWKNEGERCWLWQVTDKSVVIFKIFASRGRKAFQALLGSKDCLQDLVTDRFKVYKTFGLHQFCWAHLKRDFKKIEGRSGFVSELGKRMGSLCSLLFKWSHARDRQELSEEEFLSRVKRLRELLEKLLKRGLLDTFDQKLGVTGRFCERLLAEEEKLWAFLENRKLDLTNNVSERNLRPAVIWRKISYATQSERGQRFVERILSVVETLKIYKKNVFEYLVACFKAKNSCQLTPSFVCTK